MTSTLERFGGLDVGGRLGVATQVTTVLPNLFVPAPEDCREGSRPFPKKLLDCMRPCTRFNAEQLPAVQTPVEPSEY